MDRDDFVIFRDLCDYVGLVNFKENEPNKNYHSQKTFDLLGKEFCTGFTFFTEKVKKEDKLCLSIKDAKSFLESVHLQKVKIHLNYIKHRIKFEEDERIKDELKSMHKNIKKNSSIHHAYNINNLTIRNKNDETIKRIV